MSAEKAYSEVVSSISAKKGVSAGNLFGKPCIKLGTKAFAAFQNDEMAFKLNAVDQHEAMSLKGAHLWDPSGANRPMKEWTCLPVAHKKMWHGFAEKALVQARKTAK